MYVAAIYTFGVLVARRYRIDLPWRIAALFYALVLMFLFRPMTQAYVNIPVDFLRILPPWSVLAHSHAVVNDEMNDLVLQIVPWADEVRRSWQSLQAPLWNPYASGGYPLLANGQSSALSLIRLIALPLPLQNAMTAEAAFKLLIAMTFMFLYCRRRAYTELASTVGAISFGFCTFLIVWLHFPIVTVAAFLPAVFLAIDLLIARATQPRFAFAAIVWTVMLFGGHPETVSHAFFLALLYVAWIFLVERPFADRREARRTLIRLGAALAAGGIAAAAFLAPFAEAVTRSKRFQELKTAPNAIGYYSDPRSQIILLEPHFFGHVPEENAWGPASAESITGFAGILGVASWAALLLLTIFRRRWRSRETFFVIATVIVLGIILAWPGISTLFHLIFSLAANARLRLLLCFLLSIQAAAALTFVIPSRSEESGRRLPSPAHPDSSMTGIAFLLGLAIAAAVLLLLMNGMPFPNAAAKDTAMLAIFPSMVVLLIASLIPIAGRWRVAPTLLLIVFVIAELWQVGRGWNPTLPASMWYPETPVITAMKKLQAQEPPNQPFRIVAMGPVFFPNAPTMFGFEDIRAHDPMANGRYLGVLRVITGYDPSDYFAKWENLRTPLVNFLNVKYVMSAPRWRPDDQNRYRLVYEGNDGTIFENREVLPRFFVARNVILEFKRDYFLNRLLNLTDWGSTAIVSELPVENDRERTDLLAPRALDAPEATVTMISASPTEFVMRVQAPRYSMISSSQAYWPGWHVEQNGRRVHPLEVNGAFLGFVVRPGESIVRVVYDPLTWRIGAGVSIIALMLLVLPWRVSRRRRRQPPSRWEPGIARLQARKTTRRD